MTAVNVSTRIAHDTSRSPDVTQRISGTFAVSCPMPTCQNTTHDRTADTMRQPDVTSSEGRSPMTRPKKPAMSAPMMGRKRMDL